ncbi:GumC family protein [Mucilaginibacter sp. FT3.2]|uniref:GumC family protein n=1 Tax=Mucilaginibacter sp. FT3.2 TaxID=2723090 RepID=UPI0016113917|nr:hypothetical protein [Mucilaginibacter sp. FT3.2]MBB6233633.1 uncharacterized protein involved in exopolysaccharide biosynthesis [Mucilaginibacter sp. FT3.2]
MHLLAEHLLLTKPNPEHLGADGFIALKKIAGDSLFAKARSLKTEENVYNYITQLYNSKANNAISAILNKPGSFYYIDDLKSNIIVTRINTSDILQVTYSCSDPAVCQRTLELHVAIFTANYNGLKSNQTATAIQYFESKVAGSQSKLQQSEDDLKKFGQQNRIINYYEQTRYIAQSSQDLEKANYLEKITQSGSKRALASVEKKLNSREKQVINSVSIINMRQRLSDAVSNIEKAKIYGNTQKIKEFTAKQNVLEDSLKTLSTQFMSLNYSEEVVPRTSLVQEWVNNAVALDKANAGLTVLNNQKQNYDNEIDQFAPLGSTLKRLERQIDINQQEYLANLHGLNLARLRQNNLALNSNIVAQDKPFFPLKPDASTRSLLIIVSFLVGFILVVAVVLGREFMDSSVRSPERLKKLLDLPLAGISIKSPFDALQSYQHVLRDLLTEQLIHTIIPFITTSIETNGVAQVSLLSNENDSYISNDIQLFHRLFSSIFNDVFWVVPQNYASVFQNALPAKALGIYTPAIHQLNYKNVSELVSEDLSAYNVIFYVSPNLTQNSIPAAIAKASNINLLVINANETLQTADKELITKTRAVIGENAFFTWLVNTDETNLDGIIGEIPKKRSWLRRKVKKMIALNLR